jgi:hypothetical protein
LPRRNAPDIVQLIPFNHKLGGKVSESIDREKRSVLIALMQVEAFLRFDLPRSLAGSDGHLEPQREWSPVLEGYRLIQGKR